MSFNADALLAQRGIKYEDLIPGHALHEAMAETMIAEALFKDLGEAYQRLVFLAENLHIDAPLADCLHCWIKDGKGSPLPAFTGKRSFIASDAGYQHPLLLGMRRIAMFDVPRRIFAKRHGLWVYWLFNGVFVLSPTENVRLDWAFQVHAQRLSWGLTGINPALTSPEESLAYIHRHLMANACHGLKRIREGLELTHELGIDNVPVKGPLFEPVSAWWGSLTGRELLRRELGHEKPMVTYNCCGGSSAEKGDASAVKQLQNQSPTKRDC